MRIIHGAGIALAVASLIAWGTPTRAQMVRPETAPPYQGGPLGVMQGGTGEVNQHFSGTYRYSSAGAAGAGGQGQTMSSSGPSDPASPDAAMPAWMTHDQGSGPTPFTGWVFEQGQGGTTSGAAAFSRGMQQVDDITRNATRLMDGAAAAASDSADRLDGMSMGQGGVVIEDRGTSRATVTIDGPNGRITRTE